MNGIVRFHGNDMVTFWYCGISGSSYAQKIVLFESVDLEPLSFG